MNNCRVCARIDLDKIGKNVTRVRNTISDSTMIMAVVKADAYGHGAVEIASYLSNKVEWFGVATLDEAVELRINGIKNNILILGAVMPEDYSDIVKYDITATIFDLDRAENLNLEAIKQNKIANVHIKLDTGMSRLGFNCRDDKLVDINDAIYSAGLPALEFEGIFTHFASADRSKTSEDGFTEQQYTRFKASIDLFEKSGLKPLYSHCCNSAGLILDNDKHADICRPGIILYGLAPSDAPELKKDFTPVMTFKSVISLIKNISEGDTVSYGRTFKAEKSMRIATITAGYADGYPRTLSNKGYVLINGQKAPIIGRICMDQFCVDVTDIPSAKMGDEVILFGKELSVDVLADICDTINYEIVCGISKRVPRIIKRND